MSYQSGALGRSLNVKFAHYIELLAEHRYAEGEPYPAMAARLAEAEKVWSDQHRHFTELLSGSPSPALAAAYTANLQRAESEYKRVQGILAPHIAAGAVETFTDSDAAALNEIGATVEQELDKFGGLLTIKRRQLETVGDYGAKDSRRWRRELRRFVCENPPTANTLPRLEQLDVKLLKLKRDWADEMTGLLDELISADDTAFDIVPGDGESFEQASAHALVTCGWNVLGTPITGDQGVDIVATYAGQRVAFQCKNLSQPVGNYAVQEVFAGKAFYEAEIAAVISKSGYTASAKLLAEKLRVHLLDFSQLKIAAEVLQLHAPASVGVVPTQLR